MVKKKRPPRRHFPAVDSTYIEKVKDMRETLYRYKMLVGQRPLGDEYDRVLYKNINNIIDSIAQLTTDHTKYRPGPRKLIRRKPNATT